ncbi:MAG: glycine--tRNA ligase subunit beta [Elusimicrobiota bacterium]
MSKKVAPNKGVDFLLDVHTEPLPARFVAPALEQIKCAATRFLEGRLEHGEISVAGTLRHLILRISDVAPKGKDQVQLFKGPKVQAARMDDGSVSPAAEGFARKYGLKPAQLKDVDGVLYAEVRSAGETANALVLRMTNDILQSLQFPKVMRWEESGFKFGRPLRAITALLDGKILPISVAGVKAGRAVHGHPALAKKPAILKTPSQHESLLRQNLVIADPVERRRYLLKALDLAVKNTGGCCEGDESLIEETVFMVEHPVAILGKLRDEHMALPAALLKMVMKKQLKFFPVVARDGALLPFFVGVRDGLSMSNELIREGYQRVLEARFNDAAFFVARDRATSLESKLPLLERVTYQKTLGTMAQKAARVSDMALWIATTLRQTSPVDERATARAARLAYADLVTDVVKEFPELQGQMGGVYARADGEGERVALAVEQFYFPIVAKSPVPATAEGAVVSLAGKCDSLAGCFVAGLIPSGSTDPYSLRRQALGLLRIVLEKQLPLDIDEALERALALQPAGASDLLKLRAQLSEFIWGRAQSLLDEMGYAVDEVRSIRAGALKNFPNAFRRLAALRAVRRDPAFEPLTAAFKRAANLLKQTKADDGLAPDRALLRETADLELYDALVRAEATANDRFVRDDFEGGLKSLASLKPHLDSFFETVMVMVEDETLKRQRLALLNRLVRAFRRVADLSEIQETEPPRVEAAR